MRPPSFIFRSLIRLAGGGAALLVAVWVGGQGLEQQRFGPDETAARVRVATLVESSVRDIEARLQRVVDAAAVDPAQLQLASQREPSAERRLFVQLTESAGQEGADVSATLHGTAALPVAWTGRPVEVPDTPPDRCRGGLPGSRRPGAAPGSCPPAQQPGGSHPARRHTGGAGASRAQRSEWSVGRLRPSHQSVSASRVRPRFQGGTDAAPDEFLIRASNGDVLASVSASPSALARARDSLRGRVAGDAAGAGGGDPAAGHRSAARLAPRQPAELRGGARQRRWWPSC